MLWMKTGINMLFTFGFYGVIDNWHIWMHVLLALSVILLVSKQPYISTVDTQVTTMFCIWFAHMP